MYRYINDCLRFAQTYRLLLTFGVLALLELESAIDSDEDKFMVDSARSPAGG
jgi:hypothetical protein